jgi:very-short-patch-repair endonuclease
MKAWKHSCSPRGVKQERVRYRTENKEFRKILRNESTVPEAVLWNSLKARQVLGKKFRRQAGIGPYIVDFLCVESGLVIELDGDAHYTPNIDAYEDKRTAYLESQGLKVIRFENREIAEDLDFVMERIEEELRGKKKERAPGERKT